MPRDGNGNYTLPSGNPVATGTIIESAWANRTMSDIAVALTDSMVRTGNAPMQGPLRLIDGTPVAPGLTFASEPTIGLYRPSAGKVGVSGILDVNGNIISAGPVVAKNSGTVPAFTFPGDPDTGMYSTTPDQIGIGVGGVQQLLMDTTGATVQKLTAIQSVNAPLVTVPSINGAALWANRNKLHNPCYLVVQRGPLSATLSTSSMFLVDRWQSYATGPYNGKVNLNVYDDGTLSQASTRHFTYSCAGSAVTPTTGDYVAHAQALEMVDIVDLKWGTAQAKPIAIRFRYAANKNCVASLSIRNSASNRSYVVPVSLTAGIGTAVLTIPGDTTGVWATGVSNVAALYMWLVLAAHTSGTYTTPTQGWQAGNFIAHNTQSNLCAAVSDYVATTDWEMSIGTQPAVYPELRPYQQEVAICQRYFATGEFIFIGGCIAAGFLGGFFRWPVQMRANPSFVIFNVTENVNLGAWNFSPITTNGVRAYAAATVAGQSYYTASYNAVAEI